MRRLSHLAALAILLAMAAAAAFAQPAPHRAGLVVQYGDGGVETACVSFAEDEISGLDLLERSGLPVIVQQSGLGAAVCKIGREGCDYPAEGCFCARDGARAIYWAYQTRAGDGWRYSVVGAADVAVHDGDVNGWAWGAGDSSAGAQPPALGIDAICAPAPTARAPTGAPAAAASPRATAAAPPAATVAAAQAPPVPSPAPAPAAGSSPASYLAFAAIAAALIAGAIVAARRRRS